MDWNFLLASTRGRINLKSFWIAALVIYGVGTLAVYGGYYSAVNYRALYRHEFAVLLNAAISVQFFLMCPLIIKRLHDRDRSGWWLLPVWILPQAYMLFGTQFIAVAKPFYPDVQAVSNFLVVVVVAWAVFELFVLRGTLGKNRFGSDPLPLRFRSELWNAGLRNPYTLPARSVSATFGLGGI